MKTTIIPKNSLRTVAALLLTIVIAAGFTACSIEDNSADIFTPEKVVGKWYYELKQNGTFGEGEDAFEFDKIIIYGNLIDTGNLFFGSGFQYTTSADGGVHVVLNSESVLTQLMPSWDMTYSGGRLISTDADIYTDTPIILRSITNKQDTFVQMCLRELGMGYDDEEHIVDLSLLTSDYVAQDGDVLTGSLNEDVVISVTDGATVTLQDCRIREETFQHPVITCLGSAEIITSGTSILGGIPGYPAIYVPEGSTLTLSGFGYLHAYGADSGNSDICGSAAIGGGFKGKCKKINLNGGLVEATGGENYPAIGGGTEEECFCGNIKIYGGDISCYAGKNCIYALGFGTKETNEKFDLTIYPYIKRLFMTTEDQNAEIVHDLINRVVPRFEVIDFYTVMDFLAFFLTSLDDNVDEVKHGFRFIVGYKGTCVIPNSIK